MTDLPGYGKVWTFGHRSTLPLHGAEVVVQEKIDGSQFSFGVIGGRLQMRSKKQPVFEGDGNKMFAPAVETVVGLHADGLLPENVVFRGETLSKPKHNVLSYNRVPFGNIILFDVHDLSWTPFDLPDEFPLERVPTLYTGTLMSVEDVKGLLDCVSILGGTTIEGIVAKSYDLYDSFGSPLRAKYVSERFKEVAKGDWKERNPDRKDVVQSIKDQYRTPQRWEKALIHLREQGLIEDDPRDIGKLIPAVKDDVLEECGDEIKEALWAFFKQDILRGVTAGLPEWYKNRLLEGAFV